MEVIKVNGITKEYKLGKISSATLADSIKSVFRPNQRNEKSSFLALDNVTFSVKKGEVLGIIGHNGAGKSTLLKILSRITEPTKGSIELNGRVASLLEVGTGFHPELSGRENIFLNGAILGMSRKEISKKLDEIIDFSGVRKFVDTPVKHYSSGMYVRLAFAVAAHLEPEILIIDEVLAVGDAEFQKKCIGKMQDVAGQGRTVLFVSHNMLAVQSLCTRSILIEKGKIEFDGPTSETIDRYFSKNISNTNALLNIKDIENEDIKVNSIEIKPKDGTSSDIIYNDNPLEFCINIEKKTANNIGLNFLVKDSDKKILFGHGSLRKILNQNQQGSFQYKMFIPAKTFNEGDFFVDFGVVIDNKFELFHENLLKFDVKFRSNDNGYLNSKTKGAFKFDLEWDHKKLKEGDVL